MTSPSLLTFSIRYVQSPICIILIALATPLFGQTTKQMEYQQDWAFYFTNVNDHLSSVATDLGLVAVAPIEGQEQVFYLSIRMAAPRPDGLSSDSDAAVLWEIEDQLVGAFDRRRLNYTFAGRLTSNGLRDLYFYTDEAAPMEEVVAQVMAPRQLAFDTGHKPDPEWTGYLDFLHPNPQQMQVIQNRRVLEQLEAEGDDLTTPRQVDHWIYFRIEKDLRQFEAFVHRQGFKTVNKERTEEGSEYAYSLRVSRIDKVGYDDIDEYTLMLWEKARELHGDYDGWETSVE